MSVGASQSPTLRELESAREVFEANEPRDLFYRAATELVRLALHGKTNLSLAEALAVLLQTWNQAFYRFRPFTSQHFTDIEHLITSHLTKLAAFRKRSIETFCEDDESVVTRLFGDFERVLWPVGAAKCLHLLAPCFFPLWDRAIAEAYDLALGQRGTNAGRYLRFMKVAKEQCVRLGGQQTIGRDPLKAIDEYKYCKYTKNWL